MVGVAQWAEHLSVEQVVEGSNPFAHPYKQPPIGMAVFIISIFL